MKNVIGNNFLSMIVYYNDNQKKLLEQLENIHKNCPKTSLVDLIKKLRSVINEKNSALIENTQIGRDGLLGSLRRIHWAYDKYEKAPINHDGHDEREAVSFVFFQNAKSFIEILKKYFPECYNKKSNKKIIREITILRNFFAHNYEKDFMENKTFVRINPNHSFNRGLFELEVFDFDSAEKIHSVFFSLAEFISKINMIIKEIIDHISQHSISSSQVKIK